MMSLIDRELELRFGIAPYSFGDPPLSLEAQRYHQIEHNKHRFYSKLASQREWIPEPKRNVNAPPGFQWGLTSAWNWADYGTITSTSNTVVRRAADYAVIDDLRPGVSVRLDEGETVTGLRNYVDYARVRCEQGLNEPVIPATPIDWGDVEW